MVALNAVETRMKKIFFALGLIGVSAAAFAQKSSTDSIAEYRAML